MKVFFPKIDDFGRPYQMREEKKSKNLNKLYKAGENSKVELLVNKKASYDKTLKMYTLDFEGRVTQPSVKNFQLVSQNNENDVILMFGKVKEGVFHMDYKYPLCANQAFGICLSSLDHKLFCP